MEEMTIPILPSVEDVAVDTDGWLEYARAIKALVIRARALNHQLAVQRDSRMYKGMSWLEYKAYMRDVSNWGYEPCMRGCVSLEDIVCARQDACHIIAQPHKLYHYEGCYRFRGSEIRLCNLCYRDGESLNNAVKTDGLEHWRRLNP